MDKDWFIFAAALEPQTTQAGPDPDLLFVSSIVLQCLEKEQPGMMHVAHRSVLREHSAGNVTADPTVQH